MDPDSSIALLTADLRAQVQRLRPGDRLPSTRTITSRYRMSPVTVSRALAQLAAEGLVVTHPGSGTFVADPVPTAPRQGLDVSWQTVALGDRSVDAEPVRTLLSEPPTGTIALSGGYPHPTLRPLRALATATSRAARRPGAWMMPPPGGLPELRSWFAGEIGGGLNVDDVLITGGGQAALSTTLRAILPPGAPLLVEAPTYPGVLAAARAARLRPVPVPVDDHGLRTDLLGDIITMTEARAIYCQPTFQNPTGVVLSPERREALLAIARHAGAFVIEDDYARSLAIDSPVPPPLIAADRYGTVVHLTSLTKATAPGLRIGAVVARGPVAERVSATQLVEVFHPARPLQEAAVELVTGPGWRRHLTALGATLRRRRDTLTTAIDRTLSGVTRGPLPPGGAHLWIGLPDGTDEISVTEAALRGGVLVSPGRPYFAAEPTGPHLRLTYSAAGSEADLVEGVRRLMEPLRLSAGEHR
jgi:DNA-binding transcriptional MocR family regulator